MVEETRAPLEFYVVAILGMVGLSLIIILFVVIYQRRLFRQQQQLQAEKAQHQQALLSSVLDAQEAERVRIGRDLHDEIGAMISTVRLYLQKLPSKEEAGSLDWMMKADHLLEETVWQVRSISRDLVPTVLNQLGLRKALVSLCSMVRENSDLQVEFSAPELITVPEDIAIHVYRIAQELFNNVMKHAQAGQVHIFLEQGPQGLSLQFEDDGKGLPAEMLQEGMGLGLKNIESRLSLFGGHYQIGKGSLPGLCMTIFIPYSAS
ncbi:MAG: ATP-binding protein [Bacteroidota bacterium]